MIDESEKQTLQADYFAACRSMKLKSPPKKKPYFFSKEDTRCKQFPGMN
jgi:hypothetical protein